MSGTSSGGAGRVDMGRSDLDVLCPSGRRERILRDQVAFDQTSYDYTTGPDLGFTSLYRDRLQAVDQERQLPGAHVDRVVVPDGGDRAQNRRPIEVSNSPG